MVEVGETLLSLRKARQLSQRALAERVHVSQQAVAAWERGTARPHTGHRAALARALGVTRAQVDVSIANVADRDEIHARAQRLADEVSELRDRVALLYDLLITEREKVELLCSALPEEQRLFASIVRLSDRQIQQLQAPSRLPND
jgi:transcriptional regulator with XRE-family HTH domain